MKYIHTFWSKPLYQNKFNKFNVSLEEEPKFFENFRIGNTNGEVEEIAWITLKDVDELNWVRGQKEYIKEFFNILEK